MCVRIGAASLGPSVPAWSKFDHAATVAAAMSYLALQQQDRVGLYLFDEQIERTIRNMVESRGPEKTICPSEVARRLRDDDWRELMEAVRRAVGRLKARDEVVVTRGGEHVEPWDPGGPIRIGLLD
mgnify:CR=1 FL=1